MEIVGAPGAGYAIELLSAVLILDYGTTAYAANGNLSIQTKTTNTALSDTVAEADFLFSTADDMRVVQALSADAQLDPGEALELVCATGNPTTGDSTMRVRVMYRVHPTGLV